MARAERARFLDGASRIGMQLCRDALWSADRCSWTGPSVDYTTGRPIVSERTLGPTVYDGTAGVAWFLGALFRATGEPIFRFVADGALEHALTRAKDLAGELRWSFYSGLPGIASLPGQVSTCTAAVQA